MQAPRVFLGCAYNDSDAKATWAYSVLTTIFIDVIIKKSYDFSLTTLEAHFKCSSSTINKIFKQTKNMTMSKYVEQKRMNLANELLAQRQNTVVEIAGKCGFTNPNSFYKAYRRFYGHAPTLQQPSQESEDPAR